MPINLPELLTPISDASPTGDDLLFSNEFDAIQEARRYDDPTLDQGEWVTEIKEADWGLVVERATELLRTRTKDLRVAVWLTEALALEDGITGLTEGYALLEGLCREYWDTVHPLPEGEDVEYRLGNVAWLAGRTAELLRGIPMTDGAANAFTTLDWEVAQHVAQAIKRDPEHADDIARGKPSVEQIDASRRVTPIAFYATLLANLKAFEFALDAFEDTLVARAGDAAPSFRQTRDAFETVYRLAERFAREQGYTGSAPHKEVPPAAQPERIEPSFGTPIQTEETHVQSQTAPRPPATQMIAGIQNRAQAVDQLRAVARYFRQTEPHSPVAYLADKAAEWADMPLHKWLESVVKDDGSLSHIRELLGVRPDEQS
ncbi:type VI secretion system protein TssA [Burkholderia multivorans]|uniref:Type VI secretion system protein TssA n=1 Tax=Burkholderia multivorans TaxID=87883 RepID=A0A8E2UU86_9BURK|nr:MULTISPECIES: type VI secretion system protein TssA [Burkholderia]MBU9212179.1 type VI secretion system protein TssA [Burkholderia multivorans]MBU9348572.1 type VI secretion system protein TssA [Burkholderia multivorans]MBU9692477.1 type VI secretion system protein TssA [Burkholderia multivorans]MCA8263235.1 type VI secretion system protein TssA [Burkholderia multivorans]MCA8481226.1 type VI secretion system protein TssA [Burkholderia multivorans]